MHFVRSADRDLRHKYPILRRSRFLTGEIQRGARRQGRDLDQRDGRRDAQPRIGPISMHCFGMLMDGRAQPTGIGRRGEDVTALLILNAFYEAVTFTLPEDVGGSHWSRLIDTNQESSEPLRVAFGTAYEVAARSALLFMLQQNGD